MREIAAVSGLTPGALYNRSSSKEELLFVLVRGKHLMIGREVGGGTAGSRQGPGISAERDRGGQFQGEHHPQLGCPRREP